MCEWEDTISTVTLISTETQTELSLLDLKNTENQAALEEEKKNL